MRPRRLLTQRQLIAYSLRLLARSLPTEHSAVRCGCPPAKPLALFRGIHVSTDKADDITIATVIETRCLSTDRLPD